MSRFADVARGVAWRSIHNTLVNPAILVPSIVFPLFFLIAFAGGLSRISDLPNFHYRPGYTSFQFVFVFLQSSAFTGTVVTVAGLIAGMRIYGDGIDLAGLLGLAVLMNLVAGLWGCGVAMFLRTEQAGALIQMPVFVLLFLAPVYVPISLLSGWIHDVARLNPVTSVLESGRGLLAGAPVKVVLAFAGLAGAALLMAVFARRGLSSAERAG